MRDRSRGRTFLKLLQPLREPLERYALRNAWNKSQAQDIVQEATMIGWREFHRFEEGSDFRAWMFRILVNTVYSHNKKTQRINRHIHSESYDDLEQVLQREGAWSKVLMNLESVLDSLDERLVDALDVLSADERQCLLLRILEDLTYREIADRLEAPIGTIMSHVHRARIKLRERLSELALELRLVEEPVI